MIHVASLKLSKELYALSGWEYEDESGITTLLSSVNLRDRCPAYELGYLLRKLQDAGGRITVLYSRSFGGWYAKYEDKWDEANDCEAGASLTPEDVAVKLAIKLFEKGVLKRDEP